MKKTPFKSPAKKLLLPKHPFWEFSMSVYSHPSVKEACLALQNRFDMNVNVLLFCCWLASTGKGRLTKQELQALLNIIDKWHRSITKSLRDVRYSLAAFSKIKLPLNKLRQSILENELLAEQVEQLMLAGSISKVSNDNLPPIKKLQDAIESLKLLTEVANKKLTEDDLVMFGQLLAGVFVNIPVSEVRSQCRLFSQ